MLKVIEHKGCILIPCIMCRGVNFNGLRFEQVTYRHNTYIITAHNLDACRRLAKAGINVESGILRDYHWPSKYDKPFEHQKTTADFMVRNPRSFCFNDIGTSKTLTALWACDYLRSVGAMGKVLIVSTLSTLERVWEHEICTNILSAGCTILHGSTERRRKRLAEDHDYYIINHEGLKILGDELAARKDITHVIVDEGARFRNQRTDLWKALHRQACERSGRSVWWMTGSPMPKAPTDVWAQAKLVNPNTVPKYFNRFREQTMYKITDFKYVPKRGWEDVVYASIQPAIRFTREQCLDLPESVTVKHRVLMSKEQSKLYKRMHEDLAIEVDNGLITATNEGAKLTKLLQLACGAIYDHDKFEHFIDVTPKLNELNDILAETGDKLIIFTPFKHTIALIADWLDNKHSKLKYGIVNGGVTMTRRGVIFDEFQNGDLNIILAHPAAMAHGLTLTASNTILWWSPIDDYEIYEQAIGRITRPGQERKQYIKHMSCSKVEDAIYKRNETKESMQGLLFELINEGEIV